MALNPDCQEKVYQQIKEAVEENDGDPDLDYAAYQKMEYLEQCITEANRIYPISKFLFGHDIVVNVAFFYTEFKFVFLLF